MPNNLNPKEYLGKEIALVKPILHKLGFLLEEKQPYMIGEKRFIKAVTTRSGEKLILAGRHIKDNKKVIIKITKDIKGSQEIIHEHICRERLQDIGFSYKIFISPEEILFTKKSGYTISIQKYIEQKIPFLKRPIREQFSLALRAFKSQEGAHATTYKHLKKIKKTFGYVDSLWYIKSYEGFQKNITKYLPSNKKLHKLLEEGKIDLEKNSEIIEQYCNFLTHTDFVPHNFRVMNDKIYLLDHSSIRFGNKYEGWARFLNFMTLYNRPLEESLLFYVKNNRTEEEYKSLKLMRIFRLGEIIWYYTNILSKTSGDLHKLTETRIELWTSVLEAILKEEKVSENIISEYKKKRNSLRDEEEKIRQENLF